jgi:soluble lytic murein transglycosylase-like protein
MPGPITEAMARILGLIGGSAESPQPQDIELPYDGPWQHVDPTIRKAVWGASEKYGLPDDKLFKQIEVESQFDPTAGSHKGARGLMQLMPLMQKHYGLEDPTDPVANVDAGARYMQELLKKYNGDYKLALAAYNAGPTAVRKAGGRVPKIRQTQDYVRKILGVP